MKLFFKNKPLEEQADILQVLNEPGYDFAIMAQQKLLPLYKDSAIARMHGLTKDGQNWEYFVAIPDSKNENLSYFHPKGQYSFSQYTKNNLKEKYNLESFEVEILNNPENYQSRSNPVATSYTKEILKDFCVVKKDVQVQDKNGENYQLMIIQNADLTIGDALYVDEVVVFKNEEKVGYLKAKYIPLNKLKLYELKRDKKDVFQNQATIDYSRLYPEYKNKGLGYVMYFHMAQHLTELGVEFRQSIICSDEAQRLWQGINEHWADLVSKKEVASGYTDKCWVSFLKVAKDCVLKFEENKPLIKSRP